MGNGIARAEAESFLFKAASTDDADAIKGLVLEHHVPVDCIDVTGSTPLAYAARGGRTNAIRALLDLGASEDHADRSGFLPLHRAAESGSVPAVNLLAASKSRQLRATETGCLALHVAAAAGHAPIVRVLLENGAPVDAAAGDAGDTAAMLATDRNHAEVVRVLCEVGRADVRRANADGVSAVHRAVMANAVDTLTYLLKFDRNLVFATDKLGRTALHYCSAGASLPTITALLLRSGADVNAVDSLQRTPLFFAMEAPNVALVQQLLSVGADDAHTDASGLTPFQYLDRLSTSSNTDTDPAATASAASEQDVHSLDGARAALAAVSRRAEEARLWKLMARRAHDRELGAVREQLAKTETELQRQTLRSQALASQLANIRKSTVDVAAAAVRHEIDAHARIRALAAAEDPVLSVSDEQAPSDMAAHSGAISASAGASSASSPTDALKSPSGIYPSPLSAVPASGSVAASSFSPPPFQQGVSRGFGVAGRLGMPTSPALQPALSASRDTAGEARVGALRLVRQELDRFGSV